MSAVSLLRITCLLIFGLALPLESEADDEPLFLSDDPMAVTFIMPMSTIVDDSEDKPVVEGVMQFRNADGKKVSIDMTMTTRGRSRLAYCRFPPLKVNLKKGQTAGTVFEGQNKIKIVTLCRDGSTHLRYLQQEFGIYNAYNQITDFSYRVRWITATYKDSEGEEDDQTHAAFFLESNRETELRFGRERVETNRIPPVNLNPVESNRYELFQYLIANTDWSMIKGPGDEGCCHNGKVLAKPDTTSGWVVLPYDFDQAGLIDTRYSTPADQLPIRSVRQRLYRGRCLFIDELDSTIAWFNDQRDAMQFWLAPDVLAEKAQESALKYVDQFYKIVNDPKQRQKRLVDKCIGKKN